jgi:hypothetical protein
MRKATKNLSQDSRSPGLRAEIWTPHILNLGTGWKWVVSFMLRRLYPRVNVSCTYWVGRWVGPRADLDAVVTCSCRESNPGRPARSQSTDWAIPVEISMPCQVHSPAAFILVKRDTYMSCHILNIVFKRRILPRIESWPSSTQKVALLRHYSVPQFIIRVDCNNPPDRFTQLERLMENRCPKLFPSDVQVMCVCSQGHLLARLRPVSMDMHLGEPCRLARDGPTGCPRHRKHTVRYVTQYNLSKSDPVLNGNVHSSKNVSGTKNINRNQMWNNHFLREVFNME